MKNILKNFISPILTAVFAVSVISCSGTRQSSDADYVVSIVPEEATLELGSVFSDYRIIPLTGCLVSEIDRIIFTEDYMVIVGETCESGGNTETKNLVTLFTKDGEYVGPLVRHGRGPNEQISVRGVCYNPFTGTIDLLANSNTIVRYDPNSLEEVMSVEIDMEQILQAEEIRPIDSESYLIFKGMVRLESQEYKLYVFNAVTGQVGDRFIEQNNRIYFGQYSNFFEYGNEVYFYDGFEDFVYRYHDDTLTPFIAFEKNKYSLPESSKEMFTSTDIDLGQAFGDKYVFFNFNMCRCGMHLLSNYIYGENGYLCVIDLEKSSCLSYSAVHDDLVFGLTAAGLAGFNIVGSGDDHVYCYVEPEEIRDLISDLPEQNDNCRLISSLPDSANPVVIVLN